jgi:hypothetical protein
MTQNIPPETESRARALLGDLIKGRWEQARRDFDAGLAGTRMRIGSPAGGPM